MKDLSQLSQNKAYIIPFGGCGQFGMNLTSFILGNKHIVVDCGIMFPGDHLLGVDGIYPDVDKWFNQLGKVDAYLITHGHEDHIGSLPFIASKWKAPIYATSWTVNLIENKIYRNGGDNILPLLKTINPGDTLKIGSTSIEWINVNHSIPMSCSLFIQSSYGNFFHSGDFKFNFEDKTKQKENKKKLTQIAKKGIDLLLIDSTNADKKNGYCPIEKRTEESLEKIIKNAGGAVFITAFSSNFSRLKTILEICSKLGKKVFIVGGGFKNTLDIAHRQKITEFSDTLIFDNLKGVMRKKLVVLASGCQGEHRSSLAQIINGNYSAVKLQKSDTLVFSSRVIPGNEKAINNLISLTKKDGVNVITSDLENTVHVSGHGYKKDIESLIEILKPKAALPIHGGYDKLMANLSIIDQWPDIKKFLLSSGDIVQCSINEEIKIINSIDIENYFVDSTSRNSIKYDVLRERLKIGENGLAVLSGVFNKTSQSWNEGPDIELYGVAVSDDFAKYLKDFILRQEFRDNCSEDISASIKYYVKKIFKEKIKKKPLVVAKFYMLL